MDCVCGLRSDVLAVDHEHTKLGRFNTQCACMLVVQRPGTPRPWHYVSGALCTGRAHPDLNLVNFLQMEHNFVET